MDTIPSDHPEPARDATASIRTATRLACSLRAPPTMEEEEKFSNVYVRHLRVAS